MVARPGTGSVRIAELVATLSYAADLGLGQPMAHCMRQTVIALRLADLAGASGRELEATYYLGLMMNVYCHADAAEQAKWFGDDISLKGDTFETARYEHRADGLVPLAAGRLARQRHRPRQAAGGVPGGRDEAGGRFPDDALARWARSSPSGSAWTRRSAPRSGRRTSSGTARAIPSHLRGEEICLPARLVAAGRARSRSSPAAAVSRRRVAVARRHRGTQFDPAVVDLFCAHAPELLDGLDQASDWDAVLERRAGAITPGRRPDLDQVLEAMADLVDLKSPYLAGHSRGVANLAGEAARVVRLSRRRRADPAARGAHP